MTGKCTTVREPEFGFEALYDHLGRFVAESDDTAGFTQWDFDRHGCTDITRRTVSEAGEDAIWGEDSLAWPERIDAIALEPA